MFRSDKAHGAAVTLLLICAGPAFGDQPVPRGSFITSDGKTSIEISTYACTAEAPIVALMDWLRTFRYTATVIPVTVMFESDRECE